MRPVNQFLKDKYGSDEIIGIEIGVLAGDHALEMLENLNIKKMYLIDPYHAYTDYKETTVLQDRSQKALTDYERLAKKKLRKYADRIVWINKMSREAYNDVKEEVDFVYIDGNHQYSYVKEDIELYYPLVKKSGIMGGHDYNTYLPSKYTEEFYCVVEAVDEFVKNQNKKLWFCDGDWLIER